jgi:hypothetical protein
MLSKKVMTILVSWILMGCAVAMFANTTSTFLWDGFAIDSNSNIYIGRAKRIDVIQNGRIIRSIAMPSMQFKHEFMISSDTLLIKSGYLYCRMDLYGKILDLDYEQTLQRDVHRKYKAYGLTIDMPSVYVTKDGAKYRWHKFLLCNYVTCQIDSKTFVVYTMTIREVFVTLC